MEYKTTIGSVTREYDDRGYEGDILSADDPVPPEGLGWELVCAIMRGDTILWFWQRWE